MKLSSIVLRIFCVLGIMFTLVQPLAAAPYKQGGSTSYLPFVATPLTGIIPETTNVLTDATTQFLTSISDEGMFTFRQMTPELARVAPGEVIVGEVSAAAPYGFLRKVKTITTVNGQVTVQTDIATLEDAIEQGELHVSQPLSPTNVQNRVLAHGVNLSKEDNQFFIKLQDVVLYDADKKPETKNDQILANGSIKVAITFNFDLIIQNWKLKQLLFTTSIGETTELQVEARVAVASLKDEITVDASYPMPPITVYIVTVLGPVPIVITPILTFHVGVDGKVHVGVSAGVTQQATLTAGVRYENGIWKPMGELPNNFQFKPPTLSAGLDLKGYAGPRLTLMIYNSTFAA